MKKVRKSVNIWRSYGQEFGDLFFFFDSQYSNVVNDGDWCCSPAVTDIN